jgi:uncharacterized protein (DUF2345 family)
MVKNKSKNNKLNSTLTLSKELAALETKNDNDDAKIELVSKKGSALISQTSTKDIKLNADDEIILEAKKKIILRVGKNNSIEISENSITIKAGSSNISLMDKSLHLDARGNIQLKSTGKTIKLKTNGAKIVQQAPGIDLI